MATDYKMPRRGERCVGCARGFAPGDAICAYLFETPQGYDRRDYCPACPAPTEPGMLAMWRTRRREPQARRTGAFDPEVVLTFFRRLDEQLSAPDARDAPDAPDARTPEKLQFRFVLALLLWRKKVLRFEAADADPQRGEVWRFCMTQNTDDKFAIDRPELSEEQLERLSMQLEALLAGGAEDALDLDDANEPQPALAPPAHAGAAPPPSGGTVAPAPRGGRSTPTDDADGVGHGDGNCPTDALAAGRGASE